MVRLALAMLVVAGSSTARADNRGKAVALEGCNAEETLAVNTTKDAARNTTYRIDGTDLRVCIDKAVYPYASRRGHYLLACYTIATSRSSRRVCGEGSSFSDAAGYRIKVWMRTRRFVESSEVWLRVEKQPAKIKA